MILHVDPDQPLVFVGIRDGFRDSSDGKSGNTSSSGLDDHDNCHLKSTAGFTPGAVSVEDSSSVGGESRSELSSARSAGSAVDARAFNHRRNGIRDGGDNVYVADAIVDVVSEVPVVRDPPPNRPVAILDDNDGNIANNGNIANDGNFANDSNANDGNFASGSNGNDGNIVNGSNANDDNFANGSNANDGNVANGSNDNVNDGNDDKAKSKKKQKNKSGKSSTRRPVCRPAGSGGHGFWLQDFGGLRVRVGCKGSGGDTGVPHFLRHQC